MAGKRPSSRATTKGKATKRTSARKAPAGGRVTGMKKAEGDAPVRAYFETISSEHRAIGEKLDRLIEKNVPGVRRALKWSTPMYGLEGRGWFAAFGSFKNYTKVNFFKGAALKPPPPEGEGKDMRSINIASLTDFDEKQMTSWVKQAAAIPGWGK